MVEEIEEIRWPVLVTQLDGGTILPFMGLDEMQGALESVDIENGEYPLALDALGRAVTLTPVGNYGVAVRLAATESDFPRLRSVLVNDLSLLTARRPELGDIDLSESTVEQLLSKLMATRHKPKRSLRERLRRWFGGS